MAHRFLVRRVQPGDADAPAAGRGFERGECGCRVRESRLASKVRGGDGGGGRSAQKYATRE